MPQAGPKLRSVGGAGLDFSYWWSKLKQRDSNKAPHFMIKPKPPEGINEDDYEAIEAAVMETARGRWFLAEFSRRSHVDEMRQMLDAVARLEQVVAASQAPAAPADPSIRLLVTRLKQVGEQLDGLAQDMRAEGVDESYCASVEAQARTLGGLLRLNASPQRSAMPERLQTSQAQRDPRPVSRESRASVSLMAPISPAPAPSPDLDRRYEALAVIDSLSSLEKLRLFA
jgi:hypothetical protein